MINADVRHTMWEYPGSRARVYLETELYLDTSEDEYFMAWIELDGEWPTDQTFEEYDKAERYARDLVVAYVDGVL